ncbi:hypothetical protein AgCh_003961 [Apium graveolens]
MSDEVSAREFRKYFRDSDEDMELVTIVASYIVVVAAASYDQINRVKGVTWNECECSQGIVTTRNVTVKEVVAQYLNVLAHDLKNKTIQALFARSGETVSRQFHVGLESVLNLGEHYIKRVDHTTNYAHDNKWKWFEGVVGALDGIHIKMIVPIDDRARYQDRKGDTSTNVLATCDPNLRFTYVLPGWDGSTSDPRIYHDALRRPNGLRVTRSKSYHIIMEENLEETIYFQEVEQELEGMEEVDVEDEKNDFISTARSTNEWNEFRDNPSASAYQNKCIDNWDDICTLLENEVRSGSETVSGESNKRIKRDRLAVAVTKFAESFIEYDVHQGPVNPSLLHLQHTHRSLDIWRLGGGDMLKCRRKNPNNEDDLPPLDIRMVPLLQSTGFYGVARVASLQLDWSLISALVERWRPETHTFHLPMGEFTITLQDVGVLLGLPVDSDAIISDVTPGPNMSWRSYVVELFGRDPDPKRGMNGSRVRLSFITSCAPACLPQDASADDIRFQVLCYLVHLFGGVLFTDHSGGLFHPMFLHFIRDLDRCGDYAWGAAVLAYLYRELCKTSKKDVDEVAGCLLLLQLWAWERLPTLASIHTSSILFDARFWEGQVAAPRGLRDKTDVEKSPDKNINPWRLASMGPKRIRNQFPTI